MSSTTSTQTIVYKEIVSKHSLLVKGLNEKKWDEGKKEAIHFAIPEGNLISLSLNAFQSGRLKKKNLQEGKSEELNFVILFRNAVGCE